MDNLIPILNQGSDFLADSRDVASVFGIQHKSLRELIESHEPELTRLGVYRFETAKPPLNSTGGRPAKIYWLNFDQIIYLLTLSKSTEETREYRVRLILAFREAREQFRPIDSALLSIPDTWRKTFRDDFYMALLNLYGVDFDASKNKPSWVGNWTNKFIYAPIYENLTDELKGKRKAYCSISGRDADFIRLHQFLEEHAKDDLSRHITQVTTLMQISGSKHEFAENYSSLFHGITQMKMDDLIFADQT